MRKLCAELIGTFALVLFGCGSAIIAGEYIGNAGIALAFGLSVLIMAYSVGHISGAHFNPAVTVGLWVARRFECRMVIPYILAQLLGAAIAACVLYKIVLGSGVFDVGNFAANMYVEYSACSAFLTEVVLTFMFLVVILSVTSKEANAGMFAPIAIGLALVCVHLVGIPVTGTSVNPARSTSQVLFSSNPLALQQLWMFWAAPLVGAIFAGLMCRSCCHCSGECACGSVCKCGCVEGQCECGCKDGNCKCGSDCNCGCSLKAKVPAKKVMPMKKKSRR